MTVAARMPSRPGRGGRTRPRAFHQVRQNRVMQGEFKLDPHHRAMHFQGSPAKFWPTIEAEREPIPRCYQAIAAAHKAPFRREVVNQARDPAAAGADFDRQVHAGALQGRVPRAGGGSRPAWRAIRACRR